MQKKPPVKLKEDALFLWVAHSVLSEEAVSKAVAELGTIGDAYACALQVVASAAKRAEGKFSESTLTLSNRACNPCRLHSGTHASGELTIPLALLYEPLCRPIFDTNTLFLEKKELAV